MDFWNKKTNILDEFGEDEQDQIIENLKLTEFWKNNSRIVSHC